jgi:3-oxoacyl-[acyl-carrier protein] reductase
MAGSPRSLDGRRAVVTGGAHGIGAAIARRLVSLGATVLILDVEEVEDCAPTLHVDLADRSAVIAAAAEARHRLGRVDVLVNCAGIAYVAPLVALDLDQYDRLLAVNLHAPVLLMRELVPGMVDAGFGRIVNVTSVHARVSEPDCLAYDVAKAGLEAATRTAAVELARTGVLVNAVAPGFVATRMAVVDGNDDHDSDWFRTVYVEHGRLPAGRPASPDEIAEPVAWLASEANSYTTGQTLVIDGGLTVRL